MSIMLLLDKKPSQTENFQGGTLSAGALTDNLGNRFAVTKMLTTKWPLSAFLAELACQLEDRQLLFEMSWVPRSQNTEADAITNGDVGWLNPAKKIPVVLDRLPFVMLAELLEKGGEFHKDIEVLNVEEANPGTTSKLPLRVRDPWNGD